MRWWGERSGDRAGYASREAAARTSRPRWRADGKTPRRRAVDASTAEPRSAARSLPAERRRALAAAQTSIRRALIDSALDEALPIVAQTLAESLAPALVRIWLSEQTYGIGELQRPGGQELFPTLRVRAEACLELDQPCADAHVADGVTDAQPFMAAMLSRSDALVATAVSTRRSAVVHGECATAHANGRPRADASAVPPALELATFPLQVRGQFLGVLAVGTVWSLETEHLSALEAVADQCALAAEHDQLLSYSLDQNALAQTVVRHAPVAVAVLTGPQAVFAMANPAFAHLLGSERALRGRRLADVVDSGDRLREALGLDAVYRTGEPQAMVELPIHLDRGLTYWNVTSSPLPGRATRVGGVLIAAIDVTRQVLERQRAQEAAEIAQERIGQMMALHATSLAVASQLGTDPRELLADILRRSIALLNARAGAVYVMDQRVGELEVIVCHGLRGDYIGTRVRVGQGLAGQVAQTGQGVLADDLRLFPTSPVIYASEAVSAMIAVPLVHHGSVVGVLDVLDDADRRTFTQDDLWVLDLFATQAAQAIEHARMFVELERAYQAQRELDYLKDDFIATASHELRTPLTGVLGFLDLLLDYPGSRDEPLATEFLSSAAAAATELAELTERLLQTSRLDTSRIELHMAPVNLGRLVHEVVEAQADHLAIGGGSHALEYEVPHDTWVAADSARLREVLDNLLSNAIKYSPAGGTVRVACQIDAWAQAPHPGAHAMSASAAALSLADQPTTQLPVVSRLSQEVPPLPLLSDVATHAATRMPEPVAPQRYVTLTVADQGMGIPERERERLFGRFSRLDAARSSQIRGTGLGLYICRQLMEAMGGSIWLHDSEPGRGSVFALSLPAAVAGTPFA